jgi:hypothetical protein
MATEKHSGIRFSRLRQWLNLLRLLRLWQRIHPNLRGIAREITDSEIVHLYHFSAIERANIALKHK